MFGPGQRAASFLRVCPLKESYSATSLGHLSDGFVEKRVQGPFNPSGTSYATCSMAVSASNPFAHVHHDSRASCLQYEKNTIKNAMPNKIPTRPAAIGIPSLFSFDNIRIPNNKKPHAKPAKLDAVVIFRNHFCPLICSSRAFRHLAVVDIRLRQSPPNVVTVPWTIPNEQAQSRHQRRTG